MNRELDLADCLYFLLNENARILPSMSQSNDVYQVKNSYTFQRRSMRKYNGNKKCISPRKGKYPVVLLICGIFKKKKRYKITYLQNGNRVTDIENKLVVTREESWGG